MVRCNNCFQEYKEAYGMCPCCGYVEGEPAAEAFCLAPGTEVAGRYIIGKMVGLGGFGITYRAWDKELETMMAIKEYYPSGLVNRAPGETKLILVASKRSREFSDGKTRFLEEARNMAKFNTHPNIVNVYNFFEENNTAYIVMEFLEGRTLSQVLQQQNAPLPYDYCIDVAVDVCAALRAIHKEHILHRDVSPDNIMLCTNGTVKLFDFGAARFSAGVEERMTVVVKPGFAPPEQYDKVNRQDPRTDIYALGATLYYAMTGKKPEESTDRKIEDTMEEPSRLDSSIPQYVSIAIMRAMAVEQQYRFSSVDEFEKALKSGKAVASVEKEKSRKRRFRMLGITCSLSIVLGAAAAFLYLLGCQREAVTLPDADLTVWYIQLQDSELDQAKVNALHAAIKAFTDEYSNVSVSLEGVAEKEYGKALASAAESGNGPDIFESTGLDDATLADAVPLTEQFSDMAAETYYVDCPRNEKQYPTSITLPVIYVNPTMGTLDGISTLQALTEGCRTSGNYFVIKEADVGMYAALYGENAADFTSGTAREEFLERRAWAFFGDSGDYLDIQAGMPGEYELVIPDCGKATYQYGLLWSMSRSDEDSGKAASALLTYFNSDLAQDYFCIQEQSGSVPIRRELLAEFVGVYQELSEAGRYLTLPFKAPEENAERMLELADHAVLEELRSIPDGPKQLFSDVPENSWYADSIAAVSGKGFMQGPAEAVFAPENMISRSAAVMALYRAAGLPAVSDGTDVETELEMAAAWADESGVWPGITLDTLNEPVDLETVMALFYRFKIYMDGDSSGDISPDDLTEQAMDWGIASGIISAPVEDEASLHSNVTRGRFAVLLDRLTESILPSAT